VAATVGLVVAALPAHPAAAATSQTLVPLGGSPTAGAGADGAV